MKEFYLDCVKEVLLESHQEWSNNKGNWSYVAKVNAFLSELLEKLQN